MNQGDAILFQVLWWSNGKHVFLGNIDYIPLLLRNVKVNKPKQHGLEITQSLSVLSEYQCHRVKGILNSAKSPQTLFLILCPGKEEEAAKWAREEEEAQRRLEESRLRMEEEAARQRLEEEERKRKELELQRQKEIMRQRQQQQEALRRLQQQQQQQQLAQMKVTCSCSFTSFQLSMGSKTPAAFRAVCGSLGRAGMDELSGKGRG